MIKRSQIFAGLSVLFVFFYMALGLYQQHIALNAAQTLAESRGHNASKLGVKPSFANIILWKSVYLHDGRYYVDAIRVLGAPQVIPGVSITQLDLTQHFPWLAPDSQQARDVVRFDWFSNRYLGLDPDNPLRIIDVRYSLIPNQVTGMWGIVLDPTKQPDEHVEWTSNRPQGAEAAKKTGELWRMIMGEYETKQTSQEELARAGLTEQH